MATRSVKKKGLIRTAERRSAPSKRPPIEKTDLKNIFSQVGQKLREGYSSEAQRVLTNTIANYSHSEDDLAGLNRLLSFTLETLGKYKESLEPIESYEQQDNLEKLSLETQVRVTTQLAVAYNNLGDHPKAVTLLKDNLTKARGNDLRHLLGAIDIGLARVYRKLNESSICRDYAKRALDSFRESGDWLGMAEAYREIAISHHQEGDSERSIQYFELGVQIIGERSAPFMLGKIYTDMSGAYWFLRRSQEGIACLEKSIEFFDRTEHVLNSVIAYNNLGINLLHMGEWTKAESMISRALDLAVSMDHAHIAGIMDSLGEIKILQGDLSKAREFLVKAVAFAREKGREWYETQAMRNLARCMLAEGEYQAAVAKSEKTIELCERIGDKHHANMVRLVLAESRLKMGDATSCEKVLQDIEDNDPSSDFFVLGNIQRIRGLAALENNESELAIHHFNRSLTIFEAAEDIYHTGVSHLLLGEFIPVERRDSALAHLTSAAEIFRKLDIRPLAEKAEDLQREIANGTPAATPRTVTTGKTSTAVSQLLMVRLAEATASRELLFREVIAVLQQESQARKIAIVEYDANKRLAPFITHGISAEDSSQLARLFDEAVRAGDEKEFLRKNKLAVFNLRSLNAPPAFVMVGPASSAYLNDGSTLDPLFRVVELGLDVISLREKDRSTPGDQQISPYTSANLMPGFIHSSPAMTALVEEVYKIRSSDVTVLVTGESGTGKELVSRAIHTLSNRKDKVFVPFNCTAVPKELAEGHLFGFKKGAFTGAVSDSPGMIRSADGGTLFLDEVGDLPLDVQPKLLRFLQEGEIQPIGEKKPLKVDVRVIAATNMPLEDKVAEGTFREDLFYRLNVIRLRVPPLRERRSEIPPIVNYYINHYSSRFGKRDITFTPQTIDLLMVCEWEGNVRQLCNEVQRLIARAVDGEVITPEHLSPELKRSATPLTPAEGQGMTRTITSFDGPIRPFANIAEGGTLEDAVTELEMQMIKSSLSRHNWNISRVANELGLTRRGLYLKLTRYGIDKVA
ncbi:MAG: sigma 54-interacting transcriptional regulator [Acidobacteria bacterium]|nr:sigma 54-interacting transcriptional regulator [Acidobacteriota bacterium]